MLQTPLLVEQTPEEERKEAYRFAAEAIAAKLALEATQPTINPRVGVFVDRIVKTMRAAGAMAITTTADEPKLTPAVIEKLATTKVNGSNGH